MKNYLNFEKDIKSLENEIEKLQDPFAKDGITQVETGKLAKLQKNHRSGKLAASSPLKDRNEVLKDLQLVMARAALSGW